MLFILLLCVSLSVAQWRELEPDGPAVLTTEPNARPAPHERNALWCSSDDLYLLGTDSKLWKYEGETARWLWMCPAPFAINDHPYWSMRDLMYVFINRKLYVHNPATREWSIEANNSLFSERTAAATWADPMNNRLFMYGGIDTNGNVLNEMHSFNIETKQWAGHDSEQNPGPLAHARVARAENIVYLFGGDATTNGLPTSNLLWKMDLNTQAWQRVDLSDNTQPAARIGHVFFATPHQNKLILFGGRHGSTIYGDQWEYDLEQNKWSEQGKGAKPSPRFHGAWCRDQDSGTFLVGGSANVDNVEELNNDVWRYGPIDRNRAVAEFFRIDFNAVQLSSTIGGVCSMLCLILLVVYGLVACVYKCRTRRQKRMQGAISMSREESGNKDDLF